MENDYTWEQYNLSFDSRHQYYQEMGFHYQKTLGKGKDGYVELFSDPKGALCVIKSSKIIKASDTKTLNSLKKISQFTQDKHWQHDKLNILQPLSYHGVEIAQIGAYVSYDDINTQGKVTTQASNLRDFFKNTFHPHKLKDKTGPKIQEAFDGIGLEIMLAALVQGLENNLDQLHKKRILHIDMAARNLLVRLNYDKNHNLIGIDPIIADLDNTLVLDHRRNSINYDPQKNGPIPLKSYNSHFYKYQKYSITTDIFGKKSLIIGLLGLILTKTDEPEDLLFRGLNKDYVNLRKTIYQKQDADYKNDADVLELYLSNIEFLLQRDPQSRDAKKLALFLKHYRYFLTSVPQTYELSHAISENRKLLIQANNSFVEEALDQLLEEYQGEENVHTLYIQIQRLKQIEIEDNKLEHKLKTKEESIKMKIQAQNTQSVLKQYNQLFKEYYQHFNHNKLNEGLKELRSVDLVDENMKKKLSQKSVLKEMAKPKSLWKMGMYYSEKNLKKLSGILGSNQSKLSTDINVPSSTIKHKNSLQSIKNKISTDNALKYVNIQEVMINDEETQIPSNTIATYNSSNNLYEFTPDITAISGYTLVTQNMVYHNTVYSAYTSESTVTKGKNNYTESQNIINQYKDKLRDNKNEKQYIKVPILK